MLLKARLGLFGDLLSFFMRNKFWWLAPLVFVLISLGVFLFLAQGSAIAPFIYTLF
jgi:hypothetical protein